MADPLSEKEMAEFLVIWRERKLLNLTAVPYWTDRLIATLDLRYNAAIEDALHAVRNIEYDGDESPGYILNKVISLVLALKKPVE